MKKVSMRIIPLFLIILTFSAYSSGQKESENKAVSLRIIHTNDNHSHLESDSFDLKFEGIRTRLQLGGFSSLIPIIEEKRNDNSIVLNSGELNGTLYFSLFRGEPDFKIFNEIKLDAYALGNHAFDEGDQRLAELLEIANFPILSSNIKPGKKSPLYAYREQIKPYIIKEIDGEKIGIIGILRVEKTRASSFVSDEVIFSEEIATTKKYVKELEKMGINKIILLSHVGYFNDIHLAKNIPGIDVVVGGDSHSLLGNIDELGEIGLAPAYANQAGPFKGYDHNNISTETLGQYPTTVTNDKGDMVYVVQAWQYAYGVGILDLNFSKEGKIIESSGNIHIPVKGPFLQKDENGKFAEVNETTNSLINKIIDKSPILSTAQISEKIENILIPYRKEIEKSKSAVIGTIAKNMGYERIPTPFNKGETPTGSYAAHVVAKAFLQTNPKIDLAIQNSGGVRSEFLKGTFTVSDAIKALPFSNTVVMLDLTGEQVVQVLNESAWYSLNTGSTGAFPYAAGLRYNVNLSGEEGSIISEVEAQDRKTGIWSSINLDEVYTVSTNSFTAQGKDNYLTFSTVRKNNPGLFEDTFIKYFVPLKEFIESLPNQTLEALNSDDYCLKSVR